MSFLDKTPLKSKKFIIMVFIVVVIASILTIALFTQTFTWPMTLFMAIGMLGLCSLGIGYVLSQAALDKFISGAIGIANKFTGSNDEESEEEDNGEV